MTVAEDKNLNPSLAANAAQGTHAPGRDASCWLLAGALLVLYGPVIWETAHVWRTDAYAAHGFLIPLLTGLLVWWRRRELVTGRQTAASGALARRAETHGPAISTSVCTGPDLGTSIFPMKLTAPSA